MAFPEWALKFKTTNTELRCIRGRFYLYNMTSAWDPEKKRPKKVTLGQIGTITEEDGLIPTGMSRKGRVPKGESRLKVDPKLDTNFIDNFEHIEDPRSTRNQLYNIGEILLVTLCAVLCGAEGWKDIEDYGKSKLSYLRKYFDFTHGTPSDDTFRRFFRAINPDAFASLFRAWVEGLAQTAEVKVIAIDGKAARHSFDGEGNMLHTISAFATEARIVLGQEKVNEKSNEITAIPQMLDWLDVKGHIITIDAMGCQYKIADKIVKKEGDYIFSLKGNQSTLSEEVRHYFATKKIPESSGFTDIDKGHGRIETRTCSVIQNIEQIKKAHPQWNTIQSIVRVHASREIEGKMTEETRYFISSIQLPPERMLKAIRSHWAIENSLHWILDMSFNEDASRIRKDNAPHVMAIIRHMALNMLQAVKKERQSIKGLRKMCGWDDALLDSVIAKKSVS
jgi:predicted transposase YbfD/YdcC